LLLLLLLLLLLGSSSLGSRAWCCSGHLGHEQ